MKTRSNRMKVYVRKHHLIRTIPNDVLTVVAMRVGSSSLGDLYNLRLSCRCLCDLGGENVVLKHVSLDKFPIVPFTGCEEHTHFMERCIQAENPEALFCQGMVEYFSNVQLDLGRSFLGKAANLGHVEASYVLGVVLICIDIHRRAEGMELLKNVETSKWSSQKGFSECRKRADTILTSIWLNHVFDLQESICTNLDCIDKSIPSVGCLNSEK